MHQRKKNNFLLGFFLTPYFSTLACLIVLAVIVVPVYKNAVQRYQTDQEILDLQKQIASLESGNSDLEKLKTYLSSDQFAEKEARLNLGLKMPGEQVAVIEEPGASAAGQAAGDSTSGKNKNSNPVEWWNYFFGK